jgi:hypothetical protein
VLSLGMIVILLIVAPLGYLNLNKNIIVQEGGVVLFSAASIVRPRSADTPHTTRHTHKRHDTHRDRSGCGVVDRDSDLVDGRLLP